MPQTQAKTESKETNLHPPTSIDTRLRSQVTGAICLALNLPASRLQRLSVQEMFVLCQQHGFEVDITIDKPAVLRPGEIGFAAELQPN